MNLRIQIKQETLIFLYKISDIFPPFLKDRMPFLFQFFFLCRNAARIFIIEFTVCFQRSPIRCFIRVALGACPWLQWLQNSLL